MFGEGISRPGEILDLGVELGIISKSGSWFSYDGSKLAQGSVAAKRMIADNPELADELEAKIMAALKGGDGEAKTAQPKVKLKKSDAEEKKVSEQSVDSLFEDDEEFPDDFSIDEDALDD